MIITKELAPDISGAKIVRAQNGLDGIIYMKNLATGVISKVQPSNHAQQEPAISGNIVIWEQKDADGISHIYYKNLITGKSAKLTP